MAKTEERSDCHNSTITGGKCDVCRNDCTAVKGKTTDKESAEKEKDTKSEADTAEKSEDQKGDSEQEKSTAGKTTAKSGK